MKISQSLQPHANWNVDDRLVHFAPTAALRYRGPARSRSRSAAPDALVAAPSTAVLAARRLALLRRRRPFCSTARQPPGGDSPRAARCTSSRAPFPVLAAFWPRGALWCCIMARTAATICCLCSHHESRRRSLRRRAAPSPSTCVFRQLRSSILWKRVQTNGHSLVRALSQNGHGSGGCGVVRTFTLGNFSNKSSVTAPTLCFVLRTDTRLKQPIACSPSPTMSHQLKANVDLHKLQCGTGQAADLHAHASGFTRAHDVLRTLMSNTSVRCDLICQSCDASPTCRSREELLKDNTTPSNFVRCWRGKNEASMLNACHDTHDHPTRGAARTRVDPQSCCSASDPCVCVRSRV